MTEQEMHSINKGMQFRFVRKYIKMRHVKEMLQNILCDPYLERTEHI